MSDIKHNVQRLLSVLSVLWLKGPLSVWGQQSWLQTFLHQAQTHELTVQTVQVKVYQEWGCEVSHREEEVGAAEESGLEVC